jgi:antirestriction protein ArdC
MDTFNGAAEYHSTLFHELAHSTGHSNQLNRKSLDTPAPFGSPIYSREELVAEFGAAFLCAQAGIDNTLENSAAYIAGWRKALKADNRLVISAASQGQKAADYILGGE